MIWVTKTGQKVKIEDMEDGHLLNAHRCVKVRIENLKAEAEGTISVAYSFTPGSMAEYYADQQADFELGRIEANLGMAREIRRIMLKEIEKRGLGVKP